ncbi:vegetative cell wall protein gp1-like [Iris pallida]|uniref:Vegetative cell wall protein gp1-like n=1 Tax=Iris pallida TaxID=29817 RepID=A0AAX6FYK0_IRIPA|nr:vegetative cell wall protein gp1-like [Iris pallida]
MPPSQIWDAAGSGMLVSRGSDVEPQPCSRAPPLRQVVPEIAAGAQTERSDHARVWNPQLRRSCSHPPLRRDHFAPSSSPVSRRSFPTTSYRP